MGSINVTSDFSTLCRNLRMRNSVVETVRTRYQAITNRINQEYWNTSSTTAHSLYAGSYGRGTSIYTSDIDIIVELPWSAYFRYNEYSGNGQSALLADLRYKLLKTYSSSKVSADGQVVDIDFSDGIKFEVVPAFKRPDEQGYYYPDTNNGGSWKSMNPKLEITRFNTRNSLSRGNLKRLCRMARAWNGRRTVLLDGIVIDTIAYHFIQSYKYADKGFEYYDWLSRDFFKYLVDNADKARWLKPGGTGYVSSKYSFKSDAVEAHAKALEALDDYDRGYAHCWHDDWRWIYGTRFPSI